MDIVFHPTPCLFHEAEELLFLYANRFPMPEPLHPISPYYIPAPELARMTEEACRDIPLEDPTLRYFFQAYSLPHEGIEPYTCLARILAFSFAELHSPCASQAVASMQQTLESLVREDYIFEELHTKTINFRPRDQVNSEFPDNGIRHLSAPVSFQEKLQSVLDAPGEILPRLATLMEPIMEYLRQALVPWVIRAKPMVQAWEARMRSQPPADFFLEVLRYPLPTPASVEAGILYFSPKMIMIGTNNDNSAMKLMIGSSAGVPWLLESEEFMGWEFQALRLLGNPLRFKMLNALRKKPMSAREMAKELDLHLGSVNRDVNSMEQVGLMNSQRDGSRRRYNVNYAAIRILAKHLLSLCPEEDSTPEEPD